MINRQRVVIDTNVLISRLLFPASAPGQAVYRATHFGQLLLSNALLAELAAVLTRPQFDRYLAIEERTEFIRSLARVGESIPITYTVHACRDPKDNLLLELAINGQAEILVTGDRDLLDLDTFQAVPIITPSAYLAL